MANILKRVRIIATVKETHDIDVSVSPKARIEKIFDKACDVVFDIPRGNGSYFAEVTRMQGEERKEIETILPKAVIHQDRESLPVIESLKKKDIKQIIECLERERIHAKPAVAVRLQNIIEKLKFRETEKV